MTAKMNGTNDILAVFIKNLLLFQFNFSSDGDSCLKAREPGRKVKLPLEGGNLFDCPHFLHDFGKPSILFFPEFKGLSTVQIMRG